MSYKKTNIIGDPQVGEKEINDYLQNLGDNEFCTLCLIDVDDLRLINAQYGYESGNRILSRFLDALSTVAKEEDVIVKFGSDEFILFIKDTSIKDTNKRIHGLYSKLKVLSKEVEVAVGCSVGLAGTDAADNYFELFQYADKTLENIKKYGKNNMAWYVDMPTKMEENFDEIETVEDVFGTSEKSLYNKTDIISFAFEVFERTSSIEAAFDILIARIGTQFHLDDIKLIFMNEESMTTSIFASWYRNSGNQQEQIIEYIGGNTNMQGFLGLFHDGIFTDEDVPYDMLPPEVVAMFKRLYKRRFLVSGIFENDVFKGSIIFESNDPEYRFVGERLAVFKAVNRIIAMNMLKLRANNANEAKSKFLSKMSHDIRTPMNAIIGMTNIALNAVDDKEQVVECLKKIDSSTKYLLGLVNDILDLSKIESGKIIINEEPLDIIELLLSIGTLAKIQADEKHINFKSNIDIVDNKLLGDETKLNQVLMNLLGNAVKFTPSHGTVTLSAKQIMQENDMIKIRFQVSDNGIGISKHNQEKIFDAFEQGNENVVQAYGGSGLGLSISSHLVRMMGGIIMVESDTGEGALFHFDLPFKINPNPDATESKEVSSSQDSVEEYDFTGMNLLLVEDNDLNAEIASNILERVGFKVDWVEDGKKAVMRFAEMEPYHYDVILMDIRMPVMDGLEATNYIRGMGKKDSKTIPIYAMTANAFDEDMEKSIQYGMNGHLSKPIDVQKLYSTLKRQLAEK